MVMFSYNNLYGLDATSEQILLNGESSLAGAPCTGKLYWRDATALNQTSTVSHSFQGFKEEATVQLAASTRALQPMKSFRLSYRVPFGRL